MMHKTNINQSHLLALYQTMHEHDDHIQANKLVDLYKKQMDKELIISFSGHFSAGKSSMINALLGRDILPNSPIPTSANIVKLTSGEGYVRVYFKHDAPIQYNEPYDIEAVKDFCMNKDTIKRLDISTSTDVIPDQCAIVDTPGIDAADDADRIMTESSLHVVDILFYVMDYNHVQSEVNLQFLKKMEQMKIPYYVIINQIDKHDEKELPFSVFQQKVEQTFSHWGLTPEDIYYSSLYDFTLSTNQFTHIKNKIKDLFVQGYRTHSRLDEAVQQIIDDHKEFLKDQAEEAILQIGHIDESTVDIEQKLENVEIQLQTLEENLLNFKQSFQNQVNQTLKNAYMMPRDIRDLAKLFLESQQKDFKIGFFGAKKKTEIEKKRRLEQFLTALQKSVESNVQWILRDKLLTLLKENELNDHQLMTHIQQLTVTLTKADIIDSIHPGAQLNGQYVLNYTENISQEIKRTFKSKTNDLLSQILAFYEDKTNDQRTQLIKEREKLILIKQQAIKKESISDSTDVAFEKINSQLQSPQFTKDTKAVVEKMIVKRNQVVIETLKSKNLTEKRTVEIRSGEEEVDNGSYTIDYIMPYVKQTLETVKDIHGVEQIVADIRRKRERLENRELTIALFGAFSAGKSSLINALIGKDLMPSSPNPTTAVINRINPVTQDVAHETGIVHLKDETWLYHDLFEIVKRFSPPNTDQFAELLSWAKNEEIYKKDALNKMYQAYLVALIDGYDDMKEIIGKKLTITINEFKDYAVDEKKSAYVKAIDLFYDCEMTRQGITLVDTPGADSMNARHTDVSFDYIKYADAILYVTYYNHALSRADKDFLMQLGRVKESFERDKMFFVVNASDLAKDEDELTLVLDYVNDQLIQLGVRFPRIYPISSKQSLQDKMKGLTLNKQMSHFEHDFYQFINEDLSSIMIESLIYDINRIEQSIQSYIHTLQLDETEKERFKEKLNNSQKQIITFLNEFDTKTYKEQIRDRVDKQLYYLRERMAIRFHDMFKDYFNPTTITKSGKDGMRQLKQCTEQLLDYVGYELLQEVRAVGLRVEKTLNDLIVEVDQKMKSKIRSIDQSLTMSELEIGDFETPIFQQAFNDLSLSRFKKVLARYRGTKAFFVDNEREQMRDSMFTIIEPEIEAYTALIKQIMATSYEEQWLNVLDTVKEKMKDEVHLYIKQQLEVMEDTNDLPIYIDVYEQMTQILRSIDQKEKHNDET